MLTTRVCAQSCLTLCDPMDHSPCGSSVHRISQARNWSGLPFPTPRDLLSLLRWHHLGSPQQLAPPKLILYSFQQIFFQYFPHSFHLESDAFHSLFPSSWHISTIFFLTTVHTIQIVITGEK